MNFVNLFNCLFQSHLWVQEPDVSLKEAWCTQRTVPAISLRYEEETKCCQLLIMAK